MSLFAPPSHYDDDLFFLGSSGDEDEHTQARPSSSVTTAAVMAAQASVTSQDNDGDVQMAVGSSHDAANRAEILARNVGGSLGNGQMSREREVRRQALKEARRMHLCFQAPIRSVMTKSKLESMQAAFFDEDHNKYIMPLDAETTQWINDIRNSTPDPRSTVVMYVLVPDNIPMLIQPSNPNMIRRAIEPRAPDVDPTRWVVFSNSNAQFRGRITDVHITGRSTTGYIVIQSFQQM